MWREMSGEKKEKVRKEESVGKEGKHFNFYAKRSDLTYAYFSYMPMILLLYKEAYFNTNKLDLVFLVFMFLCYMNLRMYFLMKF